MSEHAVTGTALRDLVVCERRLRHDLHAPVDRRDPVSSFVELLWAGGVAHERVILATLPGDVADLREVPMALRAAVTVTALEAGADHVLGARIAHGDLLGMPDLLSRIDGRVFAGDVKSGGALMPDGRRPRLEYSVQTGLYSRILGEAGLGERDRAFVIGSDGDTVWYDNAEPWHRDGRSIADIVDGLVLQARDVAAGVGVTRGALSAACGLCHWRTLCRAELEVADDPTLVAGMGRSLRDALAPVAATVTGLAGLDVDGLVRAGGRTAVPGLGAARLSTFRDRARLLRTPGGSAYATEPLGLAREGRELHFDIEADPSDGQFVYLHGIWVREARDPADGGRFVHFLADGRDCEEEAFSGAYAFLTEDPASRIFHYSRYERTAYRALQKRYPAVCSADDIEALFDPERTIDLYSDIVLPRTVWPLSNMGIKAIAKSLGFCWRDADASGAASIAWFVEWRESGDPAVLRRILEYNCDDCRAGAVVLDGLIALPVGSSPPWPPVIAAGAA